MLYGIRQDNVVYLEKIAVETRGWGWNLDFRCLLDKILMEELLLWETFVVV